MAAVSDHQVAVRRAEPADVDAISRLGAEVWPAAYAFAPPDLARHTIDTWWTAEAVERSLAKTDVLVAVSGDRVVGAGIIDVRPLTPVIWTLAVEPQVQGTGVGRALLRVLVALAGGAPVRVSYVAGNLAAERLYRRFGFWEVGREPGERRGWPDSVWLQY